MCVPDDPSALHECNDSGLCREPYYLPHCWQQQQQPLGVSPVWRLVACHEHNMIHDLKTTQHKSGLQKRVACCTLSVARDKTRWFKSQL